MPDRRFDPPSLLAVVNLRVRYLTHVHGHAVPMSDSALVIGLLPTMAYLTHKKRKLALPFLDSSENNIFHCEILNSSIISLPYET